MTRTLVTNAIAALLALPLIAAPAAAVPEDQRIRFVSCARYRVPCEGPERTLWIARRALAS